MQQRQRQGSERNRSQQREGRGRTDEAVERVSGKDGGEQREGGGGGEDRRHIGAVDTADGRAEAATARQLAGSCEYDTEQGGGGEPHARPENAGLDGITDEERAAQRQRQPADPHRPAGAERGLDIAPGRLGRFRGRGFLYPFGLVRGSHGHLRPRPRLHDRLLGPDEDGGFVRGFGSRPFDRIIGP